MVLTNSPFFSSSANRRELSLLPKSPDNTIGGAKMKCMFNMEIDCPSYSAQKELGYEPNLNEIREKSCPQCPNNPKRLEK